VRLLAFLLSLPVLLYRATLRRVLPNVCRFHPSCSTYALEALRVHGPFRGTALAAGRILRCHPLHPGGLDPVPPLAPRL
jgi:putative membrane protein insertion efficiency factor